MHVSNENQADQPCEEQWPSSPAEVSTSGEKISVMFNLPNTLAIIMFLGILMMLISSGRGKYSCEGRLVM